MTRDKMFYICFSLFLFSAFSGLNVFIITTFLQIHNLQQVDCTNISFNTTVYDCCDIIINNDSKCGHCYKLSSIININHTIYSKQFWCNQNDNDCVRDFTKIWNFNNTKRCQLDNEQIKWIPHYSYTITITCISLFSLIMIFSSVTCLYFTFFTRKYKDTFTLQYN